MQNSDSIPLQKLHHLGDRFNLIAIITVVSQIIIFVISLGTIGSLYAINSVSAFEGIIAQTRMLVYVGAGSFIIDVVIWIPLIWTVKTIHFENSFYEQKKTRVIVVFIISKVIESGIFLIEILNFQQMMNIISPLIESNFDTDVLNAALLQMAQLETQSAILSFFSSISSGIFMAFFYSWAIIWDGLLRSYKGKSPSFGILLLLWSRIAQVFDNLLDIPPEVPRFALLALAFLVLNIWGLIRSANIFKDCEPIRSNYRVQSPPPRQMEPRMASSFESTYNPASSTPASLSSSPLASKICPNCHYQGPPDAKFCHHCGSPM